MEVNSSTIKFFFDNFTNNRPLDDNNPSVKAQLLLYDILIPSIGGFIILLNLAVVISSGLILKKGQEPKSTYLFLGNVAMTDLITGIAVIFGQLFPKQNRNHHICALQLGMIVSSTLTSVYSVGLIAIDRFLYIVHGIYYQKWIYPLRVRLLILFIWLIGCLIGFMPLFGWYGDTNNGKICWFILLAPKNLILTTVIIGIIPILIVVVLYSIILYHALKKIIQLKKSGENRNGDHKNLRFFRGNLRNNSELNDQTNNYSGIMGRIFRKRSPNVSSPNKWKAIKVVLFTSGSFVVTWSPYFIASIIYVYQCEKIDTKKCRSLRIVIASPLAILGFANSLINPIIYAWWHKGFRTFVQKRVSIIILKARRSQNSVSFSNSANTGEGQISNSSSKNSGGKNRANNRLNANQEIITHL